MSSVLWNAQIGTFASFAARDISSPPEASRDYSGRTIQDNARHPTNTATTS